MILFELEKFYFSKKINNDVSFNKNIFISGMPRSGTTAILRYIYNSKDFASLTYNDMPFIMAPNLFNFATKKKRFFTESERSHKDKLLNSLNSPEAFDQVFFKTYKKFKKTDLIFFLNLICLKYNKKRYLSKNNNLYDKISKILEYLPNTKVVIPFRNPLQHSFSLYSQHLNFLDLQKSDNFIRNYMNYLGHNEFGIDHIPFNKPNIYKNFEDFNYWLEQWVLYYEKIFLNIKQLDLELICYEKIENKSYIGRFCANLDINQVNDYKLKCMNKEIEVIFDKSLLNKANDLYFKLIKSDTKIK